MLKKENIINFPSENYDLRKDPKKILSIMLHYTDTKDVADALDILARSRANRFISKSLALPEVSCHYLVADYSFDKILEKETELTISNYLNIIKEKEDNENFSFIQNEELKKLVRVCPGRHRIDFLQSLMGVFLKKNFEDIVIFNLLDPEYRARHAGKGKFLDIDDFNEISIGIEIQNQGPGKFMPEFPKKQKQAVIELCEYLKSNFPTIDNNLVIGHADYAPHRKIDPGEKLDIWQDLALKNIGVYHNIEEQENQIVIAKSGDVGENISRIQKKLKSFGYDLEVTGKIDTETENVIWVFHSHFNQKITEALVWEGGKYQTPFPNSKEIKWTNRDEEIIDELSSRYRMNYFGRGRNER